jgi:hypothetical protein
VRQVRVTVSAKHHVLSDLRALAKEHLGAHLRAAKEQAGGPRPVAGEGGESEGGESEEVESDAADVDLDAALVDVTLVAKGRDGFGLAGIPPSSCFLLPPLLHASCFLLLASCFLLMCADCVVIAASSCY